MGTKINYKVRLNKGRWYVYARRGGKMVYFRNEKEDKSSWATEAAARRHVRRLESDDRNFNLRALSADDREEYWKLRDMCDEHDMTIRQAVMRGLGKSVSWPCKVSDLYAGFIAYCERRGLAEGTVNFYKWKHSVLFADLKLARVGDYDEAKLRDLIQGKGNGQEWEKGALRFIGAMWNWGYRQTPKLSPFGITKGIDLGHRKRERAIGFLTLEESRRILDAAKGTPYQSAVALMFLAGIRKAEVERLKWQWIKFEERKIWIPASIGKTGSRLIERAPEALWGWLEKGKGPFVSPVKNLSQPYQRLRKRAGVEFWCVSCVRHTFVTHHYAAHKDAEWTKAITGHDTEARTMEQRYKGVVAHREGGDYLPTEANGRVYLGMEK